MDWIELALMNAATAIVAHTRQWSGPEALIAHRVCWLCAVIALMCLGAELFWN